MHQIFGGIVLGSLFGEGARRTTWRPLLRGSARLFIQAERQTRQAAAYLREETAKLMAEARADLDYPEPRQADEPVTSLTTVQPINQQQG